MNIELVKLTPAYKTQLFDMLTEWKADIEKNHTNHSPWMIFRNRKINSYTNHPSQECIL